MNKKKLLLIIGIVFGVFTIGVGSCVFMVYKMTGPLAEAGNTFLTALKEGNYDAAYEMCTASLQTELQSAEKLKEKIETADVKPSTWSFSSRSFNNDDGKLEGSATFTNQKKGTVKISLLHSDGRWKVQGFNLDW